MAVVVGATVETTSYPGSGDRVVAANDFNAFFEPQTWALNSQKLFFKPSQWPTSVNSPQPVGEMSAAGIYLLLCFQPNPAMTPADRTNLANAIALYQAAAIPFDVCLFNEPNTNIGQATFPTPASYQAFINYYGPTVQAAGVNLVYVPGMSYAATATTYYPGDTYITKVLVDYYADAYIKNGTVLTTVMALADNHLPAPIPFGCAEIGTSSGVNVPTTQQFTGWLVNHVQIPLLNRIAQSKLVDRVMWYSASAAWNQINAGTPTAQITAMENLYNALTNAGSGVNQSQGPDYSDFNGPQGNANAIAGTGVPLLALAGTLVDESSFSIPGGQSVELAAVNITQLSYEVFISGEIGNTATTPAVVVDMSWYDATSGLIVSAEEWCIPCATSPNTYQVAGTGPTKGSQLIVTITNLDPAVAANVSFVVLTGSRVLTKDRWLATQVKNPPGLSASGTHLSSAIVGTVGNTTVVPGTPFVLLLGLYAGDVQFYMDQQGNSSANSVAQLQPWPTSRYGTASIWSGNMSGGVGFGVTALLRFPRCPTLLTYTNSGSVNATINLRAVALDEVH